MRIQDPGFFLTLDPGSGMKKPGFAGAAWRGACGAGGNPRRLHPRRPGEGQDKVHRENLQVRHQCFR